MNTENIIKQRKEMLEDNMPTDFATIEYLLEEIKEEYVKMQCEGLKGGRWSYSQDYDKVFHCTKANRSAAKDNCRAIRRILLKVSNMF